jgi:hypothetical protein
MVIRRKRSVKKVGKRSLSPALMREIDMRGLSKFLIRYGVE